MSTPEETGGANTRPEGGARSPGEGRRATLAWLMAAALVALLDQLTKLLAEHHLEVHQPVPLMPSLNLTLTYNSGAAFSLLSDAGGWQRWLFSGIAVAVGIFLVHWLHGLRKGLIWMPLAIALVLGGAAGNLYDRVILGAVVDFVDVYYGSYHWPAFNLADTAICIGAAMLVIATLRGDDRQPSA